MLTKATHVVCEDGHVLFTAEELDALNDAKVYVVKIDFLVACCFLGSRNRVANPDKFLFFHQN